MTVLGSALRLAIGNVVGVAVMVLLLGPLGIARFRDGLWLALLWLPISCVYCAVVVALFRVARLRFRSLLVVLGFAVAFLPLVSGIWPTYWATLRGAALFISLQLLLLAVVTVTWCVSVWLFTKMGLTKRWSEPLTGAKIYFR